MCTLYSPERFRKESLFDKNYIRAVYLDSSDDATFRFSIVKLEKSIRIVRSTYISIKEGSTLNCSRKESARLHTEIHTCELGQHYNVHDICEINRYDFCFAIDDLNEKSN